MKKYLAILMNVLLMPTVFADEMSGIYLKANVGATKVNSIHDIDEDNRNTPLKCDSTIAPVFMIGTGYQHNNNFRLELTLEAVPEVSLRGTAEVDEVKYEGKHKGRVSAVMINSYGNIYSIDNYNLFAGGGIGMSQVQEKLSGYITVDEGRIEATPVSSSKKNNFSYQLTVGMETVNQNVTLEVSYSFKDYGTAGKIEDAKVKSPYRGHNLLFGIRFAI